jgi:hypothetical protein
MLQPGLNQIDLRFRRQTGTSARPAVKVAVCYVGKATDKAAKRHGHGANVLARVLRHGDQPVWVDDAVVLVAGADLSGYTLVYLVAQGDFQLASDEMNVLYVYLRSGGTLLLESCHKATAAGKADPVFLDMLSSFGTTVTDLPADHALLSEPNFFAVPPAGFETEGTPGIKVGRASFCRRVIWLSLARRGAAGCIAKSGQHEWGSNIIAYAVAPRTNQPLPISGRPLEMGDRPMAQRGTVEVIDKGGWSKFSAEQKHHSWQRCAGIVIETWHGNGLVARHLRKLPSPTSETELPAGQHDGGVLVGW